MKKAILLAALLGAACDKGGGSSGGGGTGSGSGEERGRCYPNGTCNDGLVCLSEVCVRPPPADCTKVATKLAAYRLGNYAPKDEREKVIDEIEALCVAAQLSEKDGACILDATGRLAVARCPKPVLKELEGDADGCKTVGGILSRMLVASYPFDPPQKAKLEQMEPEITEVVTTACVEDRWPDSAKECIGKASSMDGLDPCMEAMPRDITEKLMKRAMPLMERIERLRDEDMPPPPPPPPPPAVDAGFATPPPGTDAGAGAALPKELAGCQAYLDVMVSFVACEKVPQDQRDAVSQSIALTRDIYSKMAGSGPAQLLETDEACKAASAAMQQAMVTYGC